MLSDINDERNLLGLAKNVLDVANRDNSSSCEEECTITTSDESESDILKFRKYVKHSSSNTNASNVHKKRNTKIQHRIAHLPGFQDANNSKHRQSTTRLNDKSAARNIAVTVKQNIETLASKTCNNLSEFTDKVTDLVLNLVGDEDASESSFLIQNKKPAREHQARSLLRQEQHTYHTSIARGIPNVKLKQPICNKNDANSSSNIGMGHNNRSYFMRNTPSGYKQGTFINKKMQAALQSDSKLDTSSSSRSQEQQRNIQQKQRRSFQLAQGDLGEDDKSLTELASDSAQVVFEQNDSDVRGINFHMQRLRDAEKLSTDETNYADNTNKLSPSSESRDTDSNIDVCKSWLWKSKFKVSCKTCGSHMNARDMYNQIFGCVEASGDGNKIQSRRNYVESDACLSHSQDSESDVLNDSNSITRQYQPTLSKNNKKNKAQKHQKEVDARVQHKYMYADGMSRKKAETDLSMHKTKQQAATKPTGTDYFEDNLVRHSEQTLWTTKHRRNNQNSCIDKRTERRQVTKPPKDSNQKRSVSFQILPIDTL